MKVQTLNLSFRTAKKLRGLAELLPKGPTWQCKPWMTLYPTKKKLHLYYRDPLECIQAILHSPLVKDFIQFTPFRVFESAAKAMRVYTEWLSGNIAWSIQVSRNLSYDFLFLILMLTRISFRTALLFWESYCRLTRPISHP